MKNSIAMDHKTGHRGLADAGTSAAEVTIPLFPLHGITEDGRCTCAGGCENPGKHPKVTKWPTAEVGEERFATIEEYLDAHPSAGGVGARMGAGVFVLDIDPRSEGFEALAFLEEEFDVLPATATALTGRYGTESASERGEHRYYAYDPNIHVPKGPLSRVLGNEYEGIDVQAEGSFVVVPPTFHRSGVRYEWAVPLDAIAEAPRWLVLLLAEERRTFVSTSGEARIGRRLAPIYERWIFTERGIPSPQWENIAKVTLALWDDAERDLSPTEIGELVYRALIRSPAYDESRPWSKRERIRDAERFISKVVRERTGQREVVGFSGRRTR